MILVDTTIVIDYTRGTDAKLAALLPKLSVAVCGIVRAELLHGARDSGHKTALLTLLATFHQVPIPEPLWDAVGDNLAALKTQWVTVPLADAGIATVGIENGIEVWARDQHFPAMQKVLPLLKLFQEPP